MTQRQPCPDCGGSLHGIRLIDKTGQASVHAPLEYALLDAERGFWLGRYPVQGQVAAMMCNKCGRILLYGIHDRQDADSTNCLRCGAAMKDDQSQCPACGWSWNEAD